MTEIEEIMRGPKGPELPPPPKKPATLSVGWFNQNNPEAVKAARTAMEIHEKAMEEYDRKMEEYKKKVDAIWKEYWANKPWKVEVEEETK